MKPKYQMLLELQKKRDEQLRYLLEMDLHDYVGPCSNDGLFPVGDTIIGPHGPHRLWYKVDATDAPVYPKGFSSGDIAKLAKLMEYRKSLKHSSRAVPESALR
jgi:hypothetical protein